MAISLKLSVTQADNCKSFTVEDATGAYAVTNTGGYGAPNFATTDVTASTIKFTKFNTSDTYSINTYSTLPNTSGTVFTINNTDVGYSASGAIPDGVYTIAYTLTGHFNITAVSTSQKTFTVSGDKSTVFSVGDTFTVTSSANNNGTYTITAITSIGGGASTKFTVSETIASNTVDGQINFSFTTSIYVTFFCTADGCMLSKLNDIDVTDCDECKDLTLLMKIETFLMAARYAARCGKPNKAQRLIDYLTTLCGLKPCTNC